MKTMLKILLNLHFNLDFTSQSWGCFTNVSRALQNNLAKIHNTRNHIYGANFSLKLCTCAQSMALGRHIKFQLEIFITSTISAIHKFRENILESSWNVSETTPRPLTSMSQGTIVLVALNTRTFANADVFCSIMLTHWGWHKHFKTTL